MKELLTLLIFICFYELYGQSCVTGSMSSCMGVNLVTNGDFSSGNSGFQTDYSYGLPANGAYLITSADASTINFGWQCTGNPGMYLLGDAYLGSNNNKAVWRQTITVKKDSAYLFSFDVNNPIIPSKTGYNYPNLVMKINGTTIYSQTIGQSPDSWVSMCYMWQATGTSATLEIVETVGNATGCDFAIDNIYFGRVLDVQKTVSKVVCKNLISLDAAEISSNGYKWDHGPTTKSVLVNKAGIYKVHYQNGCNIIKIFTVTKDTTTVKILTRDTAVCNNIFVKAISGAFVSWNNGDTGRVLKVTQSGSYIATVFNSCNDMIMDTISVYFRKPRFPVFPRDTILCHKENGIWIMLRDSAFTYKINGTQTNSVFANQSMRYIIQAFDSCNIEYKDTVMIKKDYPIIRISTSDTTICEGIDLKVSLSNDQGPVSWNTGDTGKVLAINKSGLYIASVENTCNILFTDSVSIYMRKLKNPVFPRDTSLCWKESGIWIKLMDPSFTYWINGVKKDTVFALRDQVYIIQAFDSCMREFKDTFTAKSNSFMFRLSAKDTTVCGSFNLYAWSDVKPIFWNTGDTGNVIRITQPGLYIARASNICYTQNDSVIVYFAKTKKPSFPLDTAICRPELGITLRLKDPGYKYRIDGASADSIFIYRSGKYILQAFDICNKEYIDTFHLAIREQPVFGLPESLTICKGSQATLKILPGFANIRWKDGHTTNTMIVDRQETIWINATDSCGNQYTDTVYIYIDICSSAGYTGGCFANIPNVFSPDGNNINEKFYPVFSCPIWYLEFKVFNRWGELVFYSDNNDAKWDGTYNGEVCEQGIYLYVINATVGNGSYTNDFHETGTFELLR